jgi:uncharacterized protein involved in exopolysaccharide biosynthesis
MEEQQQQTYSLRDVMAILFKHKWKILITFLVIAAGTVIYAMTIPKFYVARSVVMVKFGREFMSISEVGEQKAPAMSQEAIINTEMQLLTSMDLAGKVVAAMGVGSLFPELANQPLPQTTMLEAATLQFRQNVFVKDIKRSNLIEVYFRHANPVVAAKAVNILVDLFQEKHLQVFSDKKTSFLEEQQQTYQDKLKESEDRLARFKQSHQLYSIDEQKSLLIRQRADVDTLIRTEESKIKELQERYTFWKNRDNLVSESVATELRTQLNTLERKEQQLLERYNDGARTVQDVRKEKEMVKEQLRKQEEEVRKVQLAAIESELKPLEVKVASLKRQLAEIDGQIRSFDFRGREFADLRREVITNESNYQAYLKKSEESRISEDLDRRKMTNINVVEKATPPMMPMQTNQQKILGVGLFLSFAVSLGLAFIAEILPQGLSIPHYAAKKLRLPVLVAVPLKKHAVTGSKG